ncbi:MAG: sulfatase-like hydrolase/transferase [Planctomycetota bacterium]
MSTRLSVWCLFCLCFLCFSPLSDTAAAAERPSILWITAEDISPHLGCYGDSYADTPNLDRLARESVCYTHAFAPASVCTPARSTLITGVMASSLGTQHLRGPVPLPPEVRPFTALLRQAGYYCTNNVKEDYNFPKPDGTWDESSKQAHWRSRKPGQPFFAVFNFMTTHQSRIRFSPPEFDALARASGARPRHDPAQAPLPPYYPDTPVVRRDVARLYDLITIMDSQAGTLLRQLDADGLADDTIVFFYSDHGDGMPRHKRWIYDSGTRVPLIIHFPKKYRHLAPTPPGGTCDRMVSFVDFAPTVLSLLGLEIPEAMQGTAFLGPAAGKPREYVVAIRDRVDEVYDVARTVRDHRYRYIRNFMPHKPRMQYSTFSEQTQTRQELRRLSASGQLAGPAADLMSPSRPAEELYDTEADPYEVRNLVDSPEHQAVLKRLRDELRAWILTTRDTAFLPEAQMHRRAGGCSPYTMARRVDAYPLESILATAELVGRGPRHCAALVDRLGAAEASVRFWAATGLRVLDVRGDHQALESLERLLGDPEPSVRLAAAEALCAAGRPRAAVPVVAACLKDTDPRVRVHATITVMEMGEAARPLIADMKQTIAADSRPGEYLLFIRWGLAHALGGLGAE